MVWSIVNDCALTSGISSGTFPIHDNESIVQSHFVLMFRSKCKCILWPSSEGQLTMYPQVVVFVFFYYFDVAIAASNH